MDTQRQRLVADDLRIRFENLGMPEDKSYPILSEYFDTYWLPVIGPSASWAMIKLAKLNELTAHPEVSLPFGLGQFGASLGLTSRVTLNSPIINMMMRLFRFGFIRLEGEHAVTVVVSDRCARLSKGQVDRLPPYLRIGHKLIEEGITA